VGSERLWLYNYSGAVIVTGLCCGIRREREENGLSKNGGGA